MEIGIERNTFKRSMIIKDLWFCIIEQTVNDDSAYNEIDIKLRLHYIFDKRKKKFKLKNRDHLKMN
jgi:hypothetical protein